MPVVCDTKVLHQDFRKGTEMTDYERGFVSRCRELGYDGEKLLKMAGGDPSLDINLVSPYYGGKVTYDSIPSRYQEPEGIELVPYKPDNWLKRNAKKYGPAFLTRIGVFGTKPGFMFGTSF